MQGKWENLFWFQRSDDDGKEQLENNTTKSFLKVLDEIHDSVTEEFIEQTTAQEAEINEVSFETQVSLDFVNKLDIPIHLVGLSYWGNQPSKDSEVDSESGLVDGLLVVKGEDDQKYGLVLEVKTGTDTLNSRQMMKYRNKLNPEKESYFSWPDTYKILEEKLNHVQNEKDNFLLEEFMEYMELMDMVPFKGFDREQLKQNYKQYIKDSNQLQATYSGTKGSFARAVQEEIDSRPDSPLHDFEIVSDQINKTLHFMKKEHFESESSFPAFNHFTVGFWKDRLNVHLNIRNRIKSRVNRTGKSEPNQEFIDVILDVFPEIEDSKLMTDRNPLIYNRLERNIKQKGQRMYKTTAFDIYTFTYHKEFDSDFLRREIVNLAEANRTASNQKIGNERCIALAEKQIPFESELIEREDLPKLCVDYFEAIYPLYEHFEDK
jgi:hypothetical protein